MNPELPPAKPRIPFAQEQAHYCDVISSFREYAYFMKAEATRRARHAAALPPRYLAMLPTGMFERTATALESAIASNQAFFDNIANEQERNGFGLQFRKGRLSDDAGRDLTCPPGPSDYAHAVTHACGQSHDTPSSPSCAPKPDDADDDDMPVYFPRRSVANFSKLKTTLHQLVRDWSEEGGAERDACYGVVLRELRAVLPVTPATANKQRVLVPGCGLGRLVFDLARSGYVAAGNEFSYQMLFTSHAILNATDRAGQWTIHPWIHDPSNHLRPEDMLRAVSIPDITPGALLEMNPGADMSMTAGEFAEVYGTAEQRGAW
jgi:carnosine N-methyltransferase